MRALAGRYGSRDDQYKNGKSLGSGTQGHGSAFFTAVTVLDRIAFPEFNFLRGGFSLA